MEKKVQVVNRQNICYSGKVKIKDKPELNARSVASYKKKRASLQEKTIRDKKKKSTGNIFTRVLNKIKSIWQ